MHYKEVKSVLSPQNGLNIYRGCTHGCLYCDARSTCHRLDHDFDDVEVKARAVDMLEYTLKKKRTRSMIHVGALSEAYVPVEEELQLLRRCLLQIERFDFGLVLHTNSKLVLRDIDILDKINRKTKCIVMMRLFAVDDNLCKRLEPGNTTTSERAEILRELQKRNICAIVSLTPVLPYINDDLQNIKGILELCSQCGVYAVLTDKLSPVMREGNRERFFDLIGKEFPDIYEKYEQEFLEEKNLKSPSLKEIQALIRDFCEAHHMQYDKEEILRFTREYKNQTIGTQMSLLDFIS
ncbi:MAG: SPL family radical SAM protein [Wujia sp.]